MSEYRTGVVSGFGGKSHNYSYCVKPTSELIRDLKNTRTIQQTGKFKDMIATGAGMATYASSLASNPKAAISSDCKHILGNKYVLKTNMECRHPIDGIKSRSKYIDNTKCKSVLTGGRDLGQNCGYIPSTIASATNLNIGGILKSFSGEAVPECQKKKVKFHLVDENSGRSYSGCTPDWVYIANDDITSDIARDGTNWCEGFSNINNDAYNNFNDLYYIFLLIFIIYIIYKIHTKKF